ncbi:DUF1501 domain-containing protein [Zavarzinella formosa]|uniref:DUF1501 domain-containing protein n=1 Tax=Zavarzinella formosa TaxID=360055 RepID=UPI0003183902|nr:DUF1501 domain-containing protein [Zavarzinella formosa]
MPHSFCPGPLARREFLAAGMLGIGGLTLPDLFRMRAQAAGLGKESDPETSIIFVWLPGGPPHIDMYDMKPDAPTEIRGPFNPVRTKVPGIDVCELMPRHAAIADKFSVVRSISHDFADHGGGHKRMMTGVVPATPVDTVNDAPATGSIVAKCREHLNRGVPNYVSMNPGGRTGDVFAQGAAYLGMAHTPFTVQGDPSQPQFNVPGLAPIASVASGANDRFKLLAGLDRINRKIDASGAMDTLDQFQQRGVNMLTTDRAKKAFDLSLESDSVRNRYGRHCWGQRALMARRLVEAGVSFVTLIMENPYQSGVPSLKQGTYNWDSHAVNCHIWDDLKVRLPIYDQAVTALIEDVYQRGLDKKTMILVTGEFGRTPRIENTKGSQTGVMHPGRDHWPQAMSLIMAGAGMKTGQVVGSTNSKGEHPKDRPLTPNDLWATVYRHLGIDFNESFLDHRGRPMPILPTGTPISELL